MTKRMFPLMESDGDSGMTPGGDLMREVDWCRNAMNGVSTDLVPDHVAPVKEDKPRAAVTESVGNTFNLAEGTKPVVEDLIETLEELIANAEDELDDASAEAAIDAYTKDISVLKSIVRKLSVV